MASSNRHWPSLFKSKPCNTHHHQWQHDINSSSLLSAAGLQKNPYTSAAAAAAAVSEERSPEPKPRWNPKPEQIRILEAIFNSGMVNPPRDEIRRIRAQLQEYGQVGDANVFYWFQNRKSRSKHKQKQRHLLSARSYVRSAPPPPPPPPPAATSSSSSDRSIGSGNPRPPVSAMPASSCLSTGLISSSPVTQTNFHEPLILQCPQGYCLSSGDLLGFLSSGDQGIGVSSAGLYNELNVLGGDGWKDEMDHHHGSTSSAAAATTVTASIPTPASAAGETTVAVTGSSSIACPVSEIQGMVHGGGAAAALRSIVFINGVAFESGGGRLNVREAFWEEAVLLESSGHPVLVDEWGATVHPLQHGASYFLV